jgi:hypothetical protein
MAETEMRQFEVTQGSAKVISVSNGEGCRWASRLYVNSGETATTIAAMHRTEAGARKWAAGKLSAHNA